MSSSMAIWAGGDVSGVGMGFQGLSRHKPEKQEPQTKRLGVVWSLGRSWQGVMREYQDAEL